MKKNFLAPATLLNYSVLTLSHRQATEGLNVFEELRPETAEALKTVDRDDLTSIACWMAFAYEFSSTLVKKRVSMEPSLR